MTLTAHNRSGFPRKMTFFTIQMKCAHQSRRLSLFLKQVALRTSLIFRRFIFDSFSLHIYVMAGIAVLNFRFFIMSVMRKYRHWTSWFLENGIVDPFHIFLSINSRPHPEQRDHQEPYHEYDFSHFFYLLYLP